MAYCYYIGEYDLSSINKILYVFFKDIKEIYKFYDKILKKNKVKLIHSPQKGIISLIFKNIINFDEEVETNLDLKEVKLNKDEILQNLINEVLFLKTQMGKNKEYFEEQLFNKIKNEIKTESDERKEKYNFLENKIIKLEEKINEIEIIHENKINDIKREYEDKINEIKKEYIEKINNIKIENEKIINDLKKDNESIINILCDGLNSSKILFESRRYEEFKKKLLEWTGFKKMELIYRGSRDGMTSDSFRSRCINKGPTLTLIENNKNNIFGGYNSISWENKNDWNNAGNSFIFTLTNIYNIEPTKFPGGGTIGNYSSHGPNFGFTDIYFCCNFLEKKENSYSNFPNTYQDIFGKGKSIFTGEINNEETHINLKEIEVFKLFK